MTGRATPDHMAERIEWVIPGQFPNQHGAVRTIPNLAHSDEYVALCHSYYERCRLLNRVGGGDANE